MPCVDKKTKSKANRKRRTSREKDESRFNCPYPGCDRSCAELWRLKVHFRAPPDNKGSGIERGHNAELERCPRCLQKLETGKHHVGCRSGLAAPRQAMKREERNRSQESRAKKALPEARGPQATARRESVARESWRKGFVKGFDRPTTELKREPNALPDCSSADNSVFSSTHSFSSPGRGHQLQRASSTQSELSQHKLSDFKDVGVGALSAPPPILDCEIDDEVVIPRSFAPFLESHSTDFFHPLMLAGPLLPAAAQPFRLPPMGLADGRRSGGPELAAGGLWPGNLGWTSAAGPLRAGGLLRAGPHGCRFAAEG